MTLLLLAWVTKSHKLGRWNNKILRSHSEAWGSDTIVMVWLGTGGGFFSCLSGGYLLFMMHFLRQSCRQTRVVSLPSLTRLPIHHHGPTLISGCNPNHLSKASSLTTSYWGVRTSGWTRKNINIQTTTLPTQWDSRRLCLLLTMALRNTNSL